MSLTSARVGFFLDRHRDELMVEDRHLDRLVEHAPAQARYLDSRRTPGKLVAKWGLANEKAMKGKVTRRILDLMKQLESEGLR